MRRPALYLTAAFITGIACHSIFNPPIFLTATLAIVIAAASLAFIKKKFISHLSLYLALALLGLTSYQYSNIIPRDHVARFASSQDTPVVLRGVIVDDPVTTRTIYRTYNTDFTLKARFLEGAGVAEKVSGLVRVDLFSRSPGQISYGDEVEISGVLSRPHGLKNPGLFDYADHLKARGIHACLKVKDTGDEPILRGLSGRAGLFRHFAYKIRHRLNGMIDEYIEMPYSGFLKAIIVGDRSVLEDAVKDDFVKTGTVHVIAISGLNVAIIAAIILFVFGLLRLPRKAGIALTALILIFYSFIAGANPPIIRAVIMFAIFAVGYIIARDSDILNSLSVAALAMLLWNPNVLYDPGFQLSFVSIASMAIFVPRVDKILKAAGGERPGRKAVRYLSDSVATSVSAWLGTAPLIAANFNIISPVAIFANLVVVPILFILTVGAFIFFAVNFVSPQLASLAGHLLQFLTHALFFMNGFFADMPFAYFRVGAPSTFMTIIYYGSLALIVMPDQFYIGAVRIRKIRLAMAILVVLNIVVWKDVAAESSVRPRVTFLDVGQGDSTLLELPGRVNILIDGGSGGVADRFDCGKSIIAPFLWNKGIHRIDAVAVSHLHEDHLGGLIYILNNFDVGCVIDNGAEPEDKVLYDEYMRALKRKKIKRIIAGEGDVMRMGADCMGYLLNPPKEKNLTDSNDNSLVIKFCAGKKTLLFCGDMRDKAMSRVNSYGKFLKSDIVKVPHHGGRLGYSAIVEKFFEFVSAQFAIVSVGQSNNYHMPNEETIIAVTKTGAKCYITKDQGAIELEL